MSLEASVQALHSDRLVTSSTAASSEAARTAGRLDGRQARAERTHRRVLEGLRECLRDGDLEPTARSVALKAGVSLRAVFRHFHHLDALYAEVFHLEYELLVGAERRLVPEAPAAERIRRLVAQRARRNERLAPIRRGGQRFEPSSSAILAQYDWVRRRERDELATLFSGELETLTAPARRDAIAAVSAALSWAVWEELRRHERLSAIVSRGLLERIIGSAFPPA